MTTSPSACLPRTRISRQSELSDGAFNLLIIPSGDQSQCSGHSQFIRQRLVLPRFVERLYDTPRSCLDCVIRIRLFGKGAKNSMEGGVDCLPAVLLATWIGVRISWGLQINLLLSSAGPIACSSCRAFLHPFARTQRLGSNPRRFSTNWRIFAGL